jgi:hypothetical protein
MFCRQQAIAKSDNCQTIQIENQLSRQFGDQSKLKKQESISAIFGAAGNFGNQNLEGRLYGN